MSKTAKAVSPAEGASDPRLPFEEALAKLEAIVEGMEAAELPLEKLLIQFEEGAQLAKICQNHLAAAEVRVQQLEKNLAGNWETRQVQLTGAPTAP
ncbi:MAG TPA: exodeoxyribonuclease VII small subunit [Verrucomicrobiota bacterium]|nr:exodeoxyribonuclease VII small subunit [Verrucomicrobiales bacterium]HRI13072.1 exodeoxyribonuclease VII small subunit [Verrucomicrobiota bacterium]